MMYSTGCVNAYFFLCAVSSDFVNTALTINLNQESTQFYALGFKRKKPRKGMGGKLFRKPDLSVMHLINILSGAEHIFQPCQIKYTTMAFLPESQLADHT